MRRSIDWQIASVKAIKTETPRVKSFTLMLPSWTLHKPGQHYDVRLTAPDGYQAQRSYSIATAPGMEGEVDLTVERIEDGEVSVYMHDILVPGDLLEVRGPIGGYFVWDGSGDNPLLLVAGGSGIAPLMSMIRHRAKVGIKSPVHLLYSSRTYSDIIYHDELDQLDNARDGLRVFHTLTRDQPVEWKGYNRRIDQQMLAEVIEPLGRSMSAFICGPTLLVESAANILVNIGIEAAHIHTERFGPTGQA